MPHERGARVRVERQRLALDALRPREQLFQRRLVERRERPDTRARDSSAALSSNDGFSVVAPISVIEPSSMTGRNESCWARLKRWISSTNSSVAPPVARRARAASKIFFSSATPVWIADTWTNSALRLAADQPRHRRLAGARRAPEDHRAERRRLQHPRQRALGPGQMLLARDFGESLRAQPLGQRRRRRQGAEDVGGAVHGSISPAVPAKSSLARETRLEHGARASNDARSAR